MLCLDVQLTMQKALDRFLIPDARQMVHELTEATGPGFLKLNDAVRTPVSPLSQASCVLHGWPAPMSAVKMPGS